MKRKHIEELSKLLKEAKLKPYINVAYFNKETLLAYARELEKKLLQWKAQHDDVVKKKRALGRAMVKLKRTAN